MKDDYVVYIFCFDKKNVKERNQSEKNLSAIQDQQIRRVMNYILVYNVEEWPLCT